MTVLAGYIVIVYAYIKCFDFKKSVTNCLVKYEQVQLHLIYRYASCAVCKQSPVNLITLTQCVFT